MDLSGGFLKPLPGSPFTAPGTQVTTPQGITGSPFLSSNGTSQAVSLSATPQYAGAISALTWDGKNFINNYDHGRQLQLASFFPQNNGCYNPTPTVKAA